MNRARSGSTEFNYMRRPPMPSEKTSARSKSLKAEYGRLDEARAKGIAWARWGPYLSERQWGTVREDYSHNGDA
jgi:hypothetical protein